MADKFTPQRVEVRNLHLYIIPMGTVVDGVTVDEDTWPDNAPTTNWTEFEIKQINSFTPNFEKETEERQFASSTDGYTKSNEETVESRSWTIETDNTCALSLMLEEGLDTLPVVGVPLVPGARKESYIYAVVQMETGVRGVGTTRRRQIWAKVFLDNPGDGTPKISKVSYRVEMQDADNNTWELIA